MNLDHLVHKPAPKTPDVKPEVGMGATCHIGTDRYPLTVIEVHRDGKELVLQADSYTRTDNSGMSESQVYAFEENPNAPWVTVTLRKNLRYVPKGEEMWNTVFYSVGERRAYSDPSF